MSIKQPKGIRAMQIEEQQKAEKKMELKDEQTQNEEKVEESSQKETIDNLQEQVDILKDKLLRQLAESENIRTRSAKLIEEAKEYAIFDFTKDLMPVMDNLQNALEHIPEKIDSVTQNVVEGVRMTLNQLESAFKKHKLESIEPQSGDKFDYNIHHAISQVMTEEFAAGTIVNTMQTGYKIKDRLIRAAAVAVAKTPEK
jgi:molecular chaperone GrpE